MNKDTKKTLNKVVQIDETRIRDHLGELVRGSVEETLNGLLDAEADRLCGAQRYERSPDRVDTRAGHYTRKLHTKAGEVELKMPKLRKLPFETAIVERYKRREASIEESLIEMYLAGVSVRRVEDVTEALWGTRVSSGTVSKLNKRIYEHIEKWRNRPIKQAFPYVYLDGLVLKKNWSGEVRNISVLVAIGVGEDGHKHVLGVAEGHKEDKAGWSGFLRHLKKRGLGGVRLFISDACIGLVESITEIYPDSQWQRCVVHWYRNVFSHTPRGKTPDIARMLKAIHAQEDREAAQKKARDVVEKLRAMRLTKAATLVENHVDETLQYFDFPDTHWRSLRTNNPLERLIREIRRRTRVVGAFPDGQSALMLAAARLRHVAGTKWGTRRYLNMDLLREMEQQTQLTG